MDSDARDRYCPNDLAKPAESRFGSESNGPAGEAAFGVNGVNRVSPVAENPGSAARWPEPLAAEAYHGLAGDIVRAIEPHSESDPAALLVQFLAAFGNVIGRSAHFRVEADRHYLNLFVALVGQSAKGRKGTSWGYIARLLEDVDPDWASTRTQSGLASGEGLIWAVRDAREESVPIRERGRVVDYQTITKDPGVADKRLLAFEPELARVLRVAERRGNTLSALIRQAWDTGELRTLTQRNATFATGAHISLIGHISQEELERELSHTACANGFANRFLWICVKRSKLLPEGGAFTFAHRSELSLRLLEAVDFSRQVGALERNPEARELWRQIYGQLSEARPGLVGAIASRAEAQVARLSCLYALLDRSAQVRAEHLVAGLAVWRYAEASVRFLFGRLSRESLADEILGALRARRPAGMTRNEIREYFQRNKRAEQVEQALGQLQAAGMAGSKRVDTQGPTGDLVVCTVVSASARVQTSAQP